MSRLLICILILITCPVWCSPTGVVLSDARITISPQKIVVPLKETLFGTNISTGDKANMAKPEFIELVKRMGIKSCRFPNGCQADLYNWKNPSQGQATVDDFLNFCDAIGAEAYYTVNMQGGTEGLKGPAPENLPVDETIKYQHLMPNPCGYTNYYYGTLAETLELFQKHTIDRALAGKAPLLHYEMGNENWGQSTTDFPPEVYAKTIETYARAMREAFDKAKSMHPELKKYNLYIIAVGYPVMGNNMKLVDSPDRKINLKWTDELNKLHEAGVIDAVQEHFYPYGSANGGTLVWAAHNLHNIILVRNGKMNPRLKGYKDIELAYNMPMEHTEWNVKCWGTQFSEKVQLNNSGFENGLESWTVKGEQIQVDASAARRGAKGVALMPAGNDKFCEISQVFEKPENAKTFVAGVWVRADNAESVRVRFVQENDGEHKGQVLGEWILKVPDMWERVVASAKIFDDTKQVRLAIRAEGQAVAFVDEAKLYYTTEERGQCPISATTYEQDLFAVDAFREMAVGGCPRSHIHHLVGDYACGSMSSAGQMKDLGKVFEYFAGAYGDKIVYSDCKSESFAYYSSGNPWATDFNALAPDQANVPMLGQMVSKKDDMLYILLVNRTSDRKINVSIDLGITPFVKKAIVRTLSGNDIDLPGANVSEDTIDVARKFTQAIEPYSAQIIMVKTK